MANIYLSNNAIVERYTLQDGSVLIRAYLGRGKGNGSASRYVHYHNDTKVSLIDFLLILGEPLNG